MTDFKIPQSLGLQPPCRVKKSRLPLALQSPGLQQVAFGLFETTHLAQRERKVEVGVGLRRIQFECPPVSRDRLIIFSHGHEGPAIHHFGVRVVGTETQRVLEVRHRWGETIGERQCDGPV